MNQKIVYSVDLETSGLRGYPNDLVYEIGISELNLEKQTVTPVYQAIFNYSGQQLTKAQENAWIFQNSSLSLNDVLTSPKHFTIILRELYGILKGKPITAYNLEFELSFLTHPPFNLHNWKGISFLPCIMKSATNYCQLYQNGRLKYPRLDEAVEIIVPSEQKRSLPNVKHRALPDSIVEGVLLLNMVNLGLYQLDF